MRRAATGHPCTNTNPILDDDASAQRRVPDTHGIEVACDGMEITL